MVTCEEKKGLRLFDLLSIQVAQDGIKLCEQVLALGKSHMQSREKDVLVEYLSVFEKLKEAFSALGYTYSIEDLGKINEETFCHDVAKLTVAFIDGVCYLENPYGGFYSKEKEAMMKHIMALKDLEEELSRIGYVFNPVKALEELGEQVGLGWVEISTGEKLKF